MNARAHGLRKDCVQIALSRLVRLRTLPNANKKDSRIGVKKQLLA